MELVKETKEFKVPAGEVLEFNKTFDMISAILHTMPGWYLVEYSFDDETLETRVKVAKVAL